MENVNRRKKIILIIILIIVLLLIIAYMAFGLKEQEEINLNEMIFIESENELEIKKENIIENTSIEESKKSQIAIHIIGEVKNEGIVFLEEGARIMDAIKMAGGETKNADLSQVNLAYILSDGQKIYIPNKNEKINNFIISDINNISSSTKENSKININTANETELDNLPGIGPSIAKNIIEYREAKGQFKSIEDLKNVKGIGESKFSEIEEHITI